MHSGRIFNDEFIRSLPKNPEEAGVMMCDRVLEWGAREREKKNSKADELVAALGFLHGFAEDNGFDVQVGELSIGTSEDDQVSNIGVVMRAALNLRSSLTSMHLGKLVEAGKKDYGLGFGRVFCYEFSNSDFDRVQSLISELRVLISKSRAFEADHKKRLLRKLERLQGELHKKMSSLDVLWGLIGDAGVAIGKFGEDAKPFSDRIGEILQIVCRTQAKAEKVEGTLPLRLLTGDQTNEAGEES